MAPKTNTIVLIHGAWMTPRSWDAFRGFYAQRGYRVLTPPWPRLAKSREPRSTCIEILLPLLLDLGHRLIDLLLPGPYALERRES